MPLRLLELYSERFEGVGEPVITRDKIGRQDGRQANFTVSRRDLRVDRGCNLPHTMAMLLSVSVHTPTGAKL